MTSGKRQGDEKLVVITVQLRDSDLPFVLLLHSEQENETGQRMRQEVFPYAFCNSAANIALTTLYLLYVCLLTN